MTESYLPRLTNQRSLQSPDKPISVQPFGGRVYHSDAALSRPRTASSSVSQSNVSMHSQAPLVQLPPIGNWIVDGCRSRFASAASLPAGEDLVVEMARRSRIIDGQLAKEREEFTLKLLLLGTGESGKSTILKQMRIMHSTGFTRSERLQRRFAVYDNVVLSMHTLTVQMYKLCIPFKQSDMRYDVTRVQTIVEGKLYGRGVDAQTSQAIKRLWADEGIRQCYMMRSKFQLADSASYFFDNIDRISEPDYLPTDDDIIQIRVPTTGAIEMQFVIKHIPFSVYDVGGQRTQRRKWIHIFDNVHAIIYVCAINEYDQVLMEDSHVNRLTESLLLYDQIINSHLFSRTAMILFLNKTDLFRAKLARVSIRACFKEYAGSNDYKTCISYIGAQFHMLGAKRPSVYTHETCATDTKQIHKILSTCVDVVIHSNLGQMGMA